MVLARSLYGKDKNLLLSQGQKLKESYICKIQRLGYAGVYISDSLSDDIECESIISDQLRMSAVSAIKDVFIATSAPGGEEGATPAVTQARKVVEDLIDEILQNRNLMVNMVDLKIFDDYTFYHSVNVAVLSILVGIALGFPRSELYKLGLGALFHDIGKVFISKELLSKSEPLTSEELEELRRHPTLGFEYLKAHYDMPSKSYLGALQHHERYDGSGYPSRLTGAGISDIGRIIAVADVYDALTSDRPYRKALLPSDAMEYVMGGSGSMFDPEYVEKFTRKVAAYPLGTIVRTSNGMRCIVVRNYEDCCTRPCLRILEGGKGFLDLRDNPDAMSVTIVSIEKG